MRGIIRPLFAFALAAAAAADAQPLFRLEGFGASDLPKLYAFFDTRPGPGKPPDLNAADFRLLEDGRSTSAATRKLAFRDTGAGLGLIVAIDASRSMEGRPLNAIRQGLAGLVSRKRANDRVSVLTFADDVRWETRWDASPAATKQAFEQLQARGNGTRIYDAVTQAMDELASQSREDSGFPARLCILLLSDGHDEGSRNSLAQVTGRLQSSHVRVDTIGLARSPLWLSNLRALSDAGFGAFRAASTPTDLTQLLSQGIDALLDSPVMEFQADRTARDGKAHQFGMEYLPAHWRDEVSVTVPESRWQSSSILWASVAAAALLLGGAWLWTRSRKPPVAVAASVPAAAPAMAAPTPRRPSTMVESPMESQVRAPAPRIATTVEPRPPAPPAAPAPAKPARAATELAPRNGRSGGGAMLHASSGPYAGQQFPLSADEFWIGSAENNHLCLSADPAVSGNHACIRRENGFLRLYDNGSLNNTSVNGRLIGSDVVLLRAGDRIRIGQSELRLEA